MNGYPEFLLTALLATDLMLVLSSRLLHCIKIMALQGLILGLIPLLALLGGQEKEIPELIFTVCVNLGIKCVALPLLLTRSVYRVKVKREIEPYVGYSFSLLIAVLALIGSFYLCSRLIQPREILSPLALPCAVFTMFVGLFLIISRRKAITQAIGFLAFENGICVFGMGLMLKHGLIVELGILLDVLVLVFVMGIAVFHIGREFQHIDSDKLKALGDFEVDPAVKNEPEGAERPS